MTFLDSLLSQIPETGIPVRRVIMGPFWTLVETPVGTGLASTQFADAPTHGRHSQNMPGAGHLTSLTARTLAENVLESPSPARSVGLAALNALLPRPSRGPSLTPSNASDWLRSHAQGLRIGIVGWFPFIDSLRADGYRLDIFEKSSTTGFALTPSRARRLAACDILCITAATLLNDTLDPILSASPSSHKILVGPSSPLTPLALTLGFDAICGCQVRRPAPLLPLIQQGACFRQLRHDTPPGSIRLLTLARTPSP